MPGLFQVLKCDQSLGIHAIDDTHCHKLVGIATDGASANIAAGGFNSLFESRFSWMFWMWCLAHQIELAIKDALNGTAFELIDEMLLRLYLYESLQRSAGSLMKSSVI